MRILVVEDHQAMREIVTGHLRDRGFAADGVKRADEALAAAATIDYDAVILDLGLPDADGMEGALSRELELARGSQHDPVRVHAAVVSRLVV